jgi:hypothetical protein
MVLADTTGIDSTRATTHLTYLRDNSDGTNKGSGYNVPWGRDASGLDSTLTMKDLSSATVNLGNTNTSYNVPRSISAASVLAWKNANDASAGASYSWWNKAKVLTEKINTWLDASQANPTAVNTES